MSTQDQELQYSFSVLADSLVDRVIAGVYSHVRAGNILQVQKGSQHWVRHISAQASLLYSPSSDRASKIIVSPSSGSTTNKAFAQSFNSPRERLRGSGRRSDAEAAKNYARITRLLRQKEQEMLSAKRAQRMSDERTYPYAARSRRVRPLKKPGQSVLVKELLGRLNDEARNTKLETSDVVGLLAVQQEQARLREHRRARRLRKREMVRQRELTRKRVMKELRVRESERSGLSLRIEMTRHEQEDHARNRKEQLRKEREKEKQLQRVAHKFVARHLNKHKVPLYKRMEANYKHNILGREENRRKEILKKLREQRTLFDVHNLKEFEKITRRESEDRKKQSNRRMRKLYKKRLHNVPEYYRGTTYAKTHRDQEQAALEEKKKHQDLLNRIKKRQRYASLVKEMYHPMPSASKRAQMQERLDAFKPFNKWEVRERARANMPRYTISEIFEKKFDNIHHRNDNGSPRATYNRRQVYHDSGPQSAPPQYDYLAEMRATRYKRKRKKRRPKLSLEASIKRLEQRARRMEIQEPDEQDSEQIQNWDVYVDLIRAKLDLVKTRAQ